MSAGVSDRNIVGPARTVQLTLSSGDYMLIQALEKYIHSAAMASSGSGNNQLDSPHGMDTLQTNKGSAVYDQLWVCDTANDRIAIFHCDQWGWETSFGSTGTGNGQFDGPEDIAVTSTFAYVADTQNERVQKFDSTDESYDSQWAMPSGRLPMGIAVDETNSLVYVACYITATTGEVLVYNLTGTLQDTWTFSEYAPISVDVSDDGTKVAIGTANGYAFMYTSAGAFNYNLGVGCLAVSGEVRVKFHEEQTIYLIEKDNSRITKVALDGRILTAFGREGTGDGETDDPSGFAQCGDYIYIADNVNDRIVVMTTPTRTRANVLKIYENGNIKFLGSPVSADSSSIGLVPQL